MQRGNHLREGIMLTLHEEGFAFQDAIAVVVALHQDSADFSFHNRAHVDAPSDGGQSACRATLHGMDGFMQKGLPRDSQGEGEW